jgi:hypothetical protein
LKAQLAEALLLSINVSVFIFTLANVIFVKLGVYEKAAKRGVCLTCTGISRGPEDDSEPEVDENSSSQSIVRIVPLEGDNSASPGISALKENGTSSFSVQHVPGVNTLSRSVSTVRKAESVHADYQMHEQRLRKKNEQRAAKQRRHTQQRVRARILLRRTKTLSNVEIFQDLDSHAIDVLLQLMDYEVYAKDMDIVKQGDTADAFFAIVRGQCGVYVNGTKVTLLNSLDMFGENSLVDMEEHAENSETSPTRVRNATVTVMSDSLQVLKLSRSKFDGLLASGKLGSDVIEKAKNVSYRRCNSNMQL